MVVYVDRSLVKTQQAKLAAKCDECGRAAEEAVVKMRVGQLCLICLKRAVDKADVAVAKDKLAKPPTQGAGLTAEEIASAWPRVSQRFVFRMNGCWLWTGEIIRGGYGAFPYRSSTTGRAKHTAAHRFVYQCLVGPIPDGHVLDHLCRQRDCVNPGHLDPCSKQENIRRGAKRYRDTKPTHCPRGHLYPAIRGAYKCRECSKGIARIRAAAAANGEEWIKWVTPRAMANIEPEKRG